MAGTAPKAGAAERQLKLALFIAVRGPVSRQQVQDSLPEYAPAPQEPGIVIPGRTALSLPAGATEAEISLPNPEENEGWYYIAFELRLKRPEDAPEDAPEEVIFTTGLIPPGMSCSKVTLTRPLEKGEYPAVLRVQPYRMNDSRTPTNNAELDIVLTVR